VTECPRNALGRSECAQTLITGMARIAAESGRNCEVVVSTATPLVTNPYLEAYECPHGVTYWMEPTTDQIAEWNREGVA
jgi:hypothetical protein